ncbi:MAG: L-2-hydroxyglutarate oxidase [Acidobacteria bacterium]|nr:L-2-hydroxyglutarate oxidase [Acidobacteriota bacterium]
MATSEPRNIADISPPSDLPNHADFVIIGGGIIGLAVARQLLLSDERRSVAVLEKESTIATHQTGRSSGVVHAGIYYRPGSQKAELTRRSVGMLREYVETHGLPYIECGKLVIAASESEVPLLRDLEHRATANGVPGLEVVDRAGIERREPAAVGHLAIWSPTTAITDFVAIAERIALDVTTAGGMVIRDAEVVDIAQSATKVAVVVGTERRLITAGVAVVCAGVQSDRLAVLAGDSAEPAVIPFRGEYLRLAAAKTGLVRGLIYPVPDPNYPFLGVHLTRTVHGDVLVGPNAVLAFARDGYRWRDIEISHLRDLAGTAGFRHLAADHWRRGVVESWRSVNKRAYVRDVQRYVPGVAASDLVRARAGVRAQAVDRSGKLIDDFLVGRKERVVTVRNAPSPGATAALALAEDIAANAAAAI